MILMREKCTSSRSRDRHGLFFMNKQRMCVLAQHSEYCKFTAKVAGTFAASNFCCEFTVVTSYSVADNKHCYKVAKHRYTIS